VVSRGDVPGGLTYERLGTEGSKGSTCSNPNLRVGMLQPAIFSRAALGVLGPAVVDGEALTKTCEAFSITHDYALGFLGWMHGLLWQVKGRGGSMQHEMAGAFNVTQCEAMGVASCWEQGFDARVAALRLGTTATPTANTKNGGAPAVATTGGERGGGMQKFILHGVKLPEQFRALERLFDEPAVRRVLGNQNYGGDDYLASSSVSSPAFSAAQLPPLMPVQGYSHTSHAAKHQSDLFSRISRHLHQGTAPSKRPESQTQTPPLGSSPWVDWPVFGPVDCSAPDAFVETLWDEHMRHLKTGTALPEHDGGWGYYRSKTQHLSPNSR